MIKSLNKIIFQVLFLLIASSVVAGERQVISGAGPSAAVVQVFFDKLSKLEEVKGYTFHVPPKSAKHAGGIKASNWYIFGRTGRPLNKKEKALNKDEIFLASIPISFAVGSGVNVSSLSLQELKAIFTGGIVNWKTVGGPDSPIMVIGREEKEALFSVLKRKYPFFNKSKFSRVLLKDHGVINLLKLPMGKYGIAFGSKPNFDKASISTITVKDFSAGVSLGLVYDKKNSNHPLVKIASEYVTSEEWTKAITTLGLLPPQKKR